MRHSCYREVQSQVIKVRRYFGEWGRTRGESKEGFRSRREENYAAKGTQYAFYDGRIGTVDCDRRTFGVLDVFPIERTSRLRHRETAGRCRTDRRPDRDQLECQGR